METRLMKFIQLQEKHLHLVWNNRRRRDYRELTNSNAGGFKTVSRSASLFIKSNCAHGIGIANWAKALNMFINCPELKLGAIDAETIGLQPNESSFKDFLFGPIVNHRDLVKMRPQHFNEGFVIRMNQIIIAIFIA